MPPPAGIPACLSRGECAPLEGQMAITIRRRDFITLFGGVAVGCPLGARAQQATVSRSDARSGGRGPTVAQDIARWVVELRYEELPPDVIARATPALLDTRGCTLP